MTFDEFSRVVQEAFQSIPEAYRKGVEGVTTVETVETHPQLSGVVTLGECLTQAYHSEWEGPETTRSRVVLYYGSFLQMAQDHPDFDWDRELWETLTQELQHHLESLADEGALEAIDYAMDESFKRERDEPFDPWYFQWGEPLGEGMYRVEDEVYIERVFTAEEFGRLQEIDYQWEDQAYRLRRPEELGDIHFVVVEGTDRRCCMARVCGHSPRPPTGLTRPCNCRASRAGSSCSESCSPTVPPRAAQLRSDFAYFDR